MAQVSRQLGQKIVQVRTAPIPRGDTMDSRRMPEIMHARLIAGTTVSPDAGNRTQAVECSADCGIGQIRAISLRKERTPLQMLVATPCDECRYDGV